MKGETFKENEKKNGTLESRVPFLKTASVNKQTRRASARVHVLSTGNAVARIHSIPVK